jgi:REP element-mobilizing transposase RayT
VLERKSLFQVEKIARLFIEVMTAYRTQKKFLLHEFVVMPDHFHLIITPKGITLERSMQLIKGGFSFQLNKNLTVKRDPWQPSFLDRRIRDSSGRISLQLGTSFISRQAGSGTAAAKADFSIGLTAGLKACSTP